MTRRLLVTGAASGIGRATALAASGEGYTALTLIDRDGDGMAALAASLDLPVLTVPMDVSDPNAWTTLKADGAPDGLHAAVICAGVSEAAPISDLSYDTWRKVLAVNLDGAFLAMKAVLASISVGGSIVAVGSATGRKAVPMTAAYGASKAGLAQLVRVAALEAAPRNIRVNTVAPGGVKTPMFSDQDWFADMAKADGEDAAWSALSAGTPLGRLAEADEIARAIHWLLSDAAALMTGATLDVDGGYGI